MWSVKMKILRISVSFSKIVFKIIFWLLFILFTIMVFVKFINQIVMKDCMEPNGLLEICEMD